MNKCGRRPCYSRETACFHIAATASVEVMREWRGQTARSSIKLFQGCADDAHTWSVTTDGSIGHVADWKLPFSLPFMFENIFVRVSKRAFGRVKG